MASCRARATLRNTDAEHRLRQCRPRSVTGVSRRLSTWLNSLISQYDAAMRPEVGERDGIAMRSASAAAPRGRTVRVSQEIAPTLV